MRPYLDVIIYRQKTFWTKFISNSNYFLSKNFQIFIKLITKKNQDAIYDLCSFNIENLSSETCVIRLKIPYLWFGLNEEQFDNV